MRQTTRPTMLMMTDVFLSVMVVCATRARFLAKPLTATQEVYLRILQESPAVFTDRRCGHEASSRTQ
jgi:hypothetical protein